MVIFFLFRYHQKCYSNFENATKIESAEKRYIKAMDEERISKHKNGWKTNFMFQSPNFRRLKTKSKSEPYLKESCITCKIPDGSLSKVKFEAIGKHMFKVSKKLEVKDSSAG